VFADAGMEKESSLPSTSIIIISERGAAADPQRPTDNLDGGWTN
jgi:hypothetical protein